jgi:hypothetical protein
MSGRSEILGGGGLIKTAASLAYIDILNLVQQPCRGGLKPLAVGLFETIDVTAPWLVRIILERAGPPT